MKNKNKYLVFGSILIMTLLNLNFVSAEALVSDAGVEYDSKITESFNDQNLARHKNKQTQVGESFI